MRPRQREEGSLWGAVRRPPKAAPDAAATAAQRQALALQQQAGNAAVAGKVAQRSWLDGLMGQWGGGQEEEEDADPADRGDSHDYGDYDPNGQGYKGGKEYQKGDQKGYEVPEEQDWGGPIKGGSKDDGSGYDQPKDDGKGATPPASNPKDDMYDDLVY